MDGPPRPVPGLGKERVETLVDGVMAIAMTLLVLEIRVPPVGEQVAQGLLALAPSFLAYALSFANLGVYWVGHHAQFDVIRRADRPFIWINIAFMLFVALIPFSTALLAAHPRERDAVLFYGFNLLATGMLLFANWRYATNQRRLVDAELNPLLIRFGGVRTLVGSVVVLVAMALALVDTRISIVLFIAVPFYYIFPGRVDKLFLRRAT
jgi:uncharacterized membrane protein